jgi:TetR/AcrR family transcriptional regulator, transcriptional repressor for nem operon
MPAQSTRDLIIEKADARFYEGGFEATSFGDIAAAVGISRGNFYYYFRTKDEILSAVIDRRLANTRQLLDQWEADGADPRKLLLTRSELTPGGGSPSPPRTSQSAGSGPAHTRGAPRA